MFFNLDCYAEKDTDPVWDEMYHPGLNELDDKSRPEINNLICP